MMYEIIVRFYLINIQKIIEVSLDNRLTFNENLYYLDKMLKDYNLKDKYIYDPNKRIFLSKDKILKDMGIHSFMTFYLY